MLATAIRMQAERVSRLASADDLHRLELWAIAMDLEDESKVAGEFASNLWHRGTRTDYHFAEFT